MKISFEFLVLFGLCSLLIVIFIAPDHESKILYARVIESLVTGFLGYITRGVVENYSRSSEEKLLRRRKQIRHELNQLNQLNNNDELN